MSPCLRPCPKAMPLEAGDHPRRATRATSKSFRRAAIFINRPPPVNRALGKHRTMRGRVATIALLALTAAQAPQRAPIEGYWKNPIGSAIIEIAPCSAALCGKVVWASARGKREVAKNTANVVGTTVLTGLHERGKRWTGSLYIPDDNIHVAARLQLLNSRQLKLTGCGLMGLRS